MHMPVVHEQWSVCPHPSFTVPQSCVCESGVQVVGTHASFAAAPASLGGGGVTHWLSTHAWPPVQTPQSIATPHASKPISPHCVPQTPAVPPFHRHDCDVGLPGSGMQSWPVGHTDPHANTTPLQGSV